MASGMVETKGAGEVAVANKNYSPWKVVVYSSLSIWISEMLNYPLDTISTKIKAHTAKFLSFKEGYQHIVNKNGARGLVRGITTTFPGTFVPGLIYFSAYESFNKTVKKFVDGCEKESTRDGFTLMMPLFTSTFAELISLVPYIPYDLVRTRMQLNDDQYNYKNVRHGLRDVIEKEGLVRLYKASHIIILTTSLQTGFLFWFYEMQKFFILKRQRKQIEGEGRNIQALHQLSIKQSIYITCTSSIITTFIMNPLDLILTRFQALDSSKQALCVKTITRDLVKNEGYIAFLKGITPRIAIQCAYSLLILPVYEHCKAKYGLPILDD